ncbi:MAG: flagellar biosynthetic protein FliR [Bdellovibrionota bacterium]|jgi:flagellar biosynthetic protein FliR
MDTTLFFPINLLERYDVIWSFLLVFTRFAAMMTIVPGVGGGIRGMTIRIPAILFMTYAATINGAYAEMPADWGAVIAGIFSELLFGLMLGAIPAMVIAGVQTGMQLSSTAMGLSAGQMYDPTMGISITPLSRFVGDLTICFFLLFGGHHYVIYAASGLGGVIVPGSFLITETGIKLLIDRSALIFEAGVMVSAPAIVAILLTKFVMGLISRAVPQVNIFIIAFPLTIGIGLILTALSIPEIAEYVERDFKRSEQEILVLSNETKQIKQVDK